MLLTAFVDGQPIERSGVINFCHVSKEPRAMDSLIVHFVPDNLRRPVLILAWAGWNDAAESATTAARYLGTAFGAQKFAEIDPEEFYHFGLTRPVARFKPGSETEREIVWPVTEFSVTQSPELNRDVAIGVGSEPHLAWKRYCAHVVDVATRVRASLVLTLGALLAEVPHTRAVKLVGSASDPEIAQWLGLRPSRYEGPTGIVGVFNTLAREAGFSTASLWANVPHYISGIENPKATLALVRRVLGMIGGAPDLSDLEEASRQFDANLAEVVSQNKKIASYVAKLEKNDVEEPPPTRGQSDLPPASELLSEFEQFLRQQRPGGPKD
jgi:proteasome assembly chaperone (PAC2) family protein